MKKKLIGLILILLLGFPCISGAPPPPVSAINVTEADTSPSAWAYKLIFPNGTITDNGDGTVTIITDPDIGAATGTSLLATGIVDGLTNTTIWTTGAITANPAGKMSHIIVNKHATPATAFPVTLSTPVAGMQLIVKNGQGAGGTNTGVITLVAGSNVIIYNPTTKVDCAATQNLVSGGAAGDYVAMVALDSTHWESVGAQGTWACVTP